MNSNERLEQVSIAMLTMCLENKRLSGVFVDDLIGSFSNKHEAKEILKQYLVKMDFLQPSDDKKFYKITALGRAYLSKSSSSTVNYSNISNSNIAHLSPNSVQSVEITDLSDELQQKILEFDEAVKQKDGDTLKKTFSYIADKSVDVAIALVTGAIMR